MTSSRSTSRASGDAVPVLGQGAPAPAAASPGRALAGPPLEDDRKADSQLPGASFSSPRDSPALRDGAPARRIHVVGGSGMGKTTMARTIAATLGVPAVHLDEVARTARSDADRRSAVATIARTEAWVSEGIQLGWSEPLFDAADVIVWLDSGSRLAAVRRIGARFVARSLQETRSRPRAAFRPRSYAFHLRELVRHVRETSRYYGSERAGPQQAPAPHTRRATIDCLLPRADRTVRCVDRSDVDELLRRLAAGRSR